MRPLQWQPAEPLTTQVFEKKRKDFCVGALPADFDNATMSERLMTQVISAVAVSRVIRGGAHRAIRSHCLAFDAMSGPAATLSPARMGGVAAYRVVLAGPFTTEQQARIWKMHRVRRQVVDDLLQFYREYNPMYANVFIDCAALADKPVPDGIFCDALDTDLEGDRGGGMCNGATTTNNRDHRAVRCARPRQLRGQPPDRMRSRWRAYSQCVVAAPIPSPTL